MGGVPWTKEEDNLLKKCILQYGEGNWHRLPLLSGLKRCRKSCRLRWLNYLRPNIKRGSFSHDEVQLILKLHKLVGNRWTVIAGSLPGRTANDVKNYWNCHLSKKLLLNTKNKNADDGGKSKMMMISSRSADEEEEAPLNMNEAQADQQQVDINSGINYTPTPTPITSSSYVEDLPLPFMDFEFQPLKPTNQCDNWDDFTLDFDLI